MQPLPGKTNNGTWNSKVGGVHVPGVRVGGIELNKRLEGSIEIRRDLDSRSLESYESMRDVEQCIGVIYFRPKQVDVLPCWIKREFTIPANIYHPTLHLASWLKNKIR